MLWSAGKYLTSIVDLKVRRCLTAEIFTSVLVWGLSNSVTDVLKLREIYVYWTCTLKGIITDLALTAETI